MKRNWITTSVLLIGLIHLASCGGGMEGATSSDQNGDYMYVEDSYALMEATEKVEEEMYLVLDDEVGNQFNTEEYHYIPENDFLSPGTNPLSTFSIDVDNASYTNVRRMLNDGYWPGVDAVRTEELVNYFDYNYPVPKKDEVFSVYTEVGACPWNEENKLVHIGLQGYTMPIEELPPSNLVFLIDVSGSMGDQNKLPLLKKSYKMMVDRLNEKDRVSIVTYAGDERLVLPSTSCAYKDEIKAAIDNLESGRGTNGEGGIEMAYTQAVENFIDDGNNRVILATDGDFNIGRSSGGELTRLIEEKRDLGVYLTILGFGMGNYKDSKMESLADHGNGNYFYVDDISESNRILVENLAGTLLTIAKDVKIQVEFNPALVKEYRLIGYENRLMNAEDFADDKKDAGELGAGHTVTAIYEIVLGKAETSELKYQTSSTNPSSELATIKLRYKKPDEDRSNLLETSVMSNDKRFANTSEEFQFSAAVAAYSLILRESKYINDFNFSDVLEIAKPVVGMNDMSRVEFLQLVEKARLLSEDV